MKLTSTRTNPVMAEALRACRRHFGYALLFSAAVNLLFIAPMLYMLQVYDRVIPTAGGTTLLLLTFVLAFSLLTLSGLDAIRSRLLVRAGVRLDKVLSGTIIDATLVRPDGAGQRLARQAVREFDTLRQALTGPAILALLDAPWVPVYILIGFLIHPWIGVLALVGAGLNVLLAWQNERATRNRLDQANSAAGRTYAEFEFTAASADVIRALGLRRAMVQGHLADRSRMLQLQTDASLASGGLTATSKFVRLLLQSLALGLGALLAINSLISPGAVFASMFIIGRALAPIDQLVGSWKTIVQARGAYRTLNELLDETPPDVALTQLPRPGGRLEVEGVAVLDPQRRPIIANISFAVHPGEVVAIVGPSGAGKSTLVRALAGALIPATGSIRFDGADQSNWDPERLAEHVGFMPQDSMLFAGTVKDNISRFRNRLGEDGAAVDADTIAAAEAAGAHEMIMRLPGGYDQPIGINGRGLSAGQAQRVALARALFRNPRYLILDEPNASLDAEGEAHLARTLEAAKARGTTILLVAHRMSVLQVVDKLMVIRDGRIALYGPRDEVLAKITPQPPQPQPQPRVASMTPRAQV
jgi:ATP-binding cassette subfamily C protein